MSSRPSFPSVAFHGKSQKLGVGTLEGAVSVASARDWPTLKSEADLPLLPR